MHDNGEVISNKIGEVAGLLIDTAKRILPCVQPRRRMKWRDDVLNRLCAQSRQARAAWKGTGTPIEGPLSEQKNRLQRAVRKEVQWCAARSERLQVQKRDRLFVAQDSRRFKTPQTKKSRWSKLVVGGEII